MHKILIIGCSGAGKTTLAKELSQKLELPVYSLDHYIWLPGWVQSDPVKTREDMFMLCKKTHWIIDGTYTKTLSLRIGFADTIIFLDIAPKIRFWRIFKRYVKLTFSGKEMAPGCPVTLNKPFLKYVWHFDTQSRPFILKLLQAVDQSKKIYILKSAQDIKKFLVSIKNME